MDGQQKADPLWWEARWAELQISTREASPWTGGCVHDINCETPLNGFISNTYMPHINMSTIHMAQFIAEQFYLTITSKLKVIVRLIMML